MDGYRYLGKLYTDDYYGALILYIYTDGTYYYCSFCDMDNYDLTEDGCRPKRLFRDDTGWYRYTRGGEKKYLYYKVNEGARDKYYVVQAIERDVFF